jgi:hypothetical protein
VDDSTACGVVAFLPPQTEKFPVNSLFISELKAETGSRQTASSAIPCVMKSVRQHEVALRHDALMTIGERFHTILEDAVLGGHHAHNLKPAERLRTAVAAEKFDGLFDFEFMWRHGGVRSNGIRQR